MPIPFGEVDFIISSNGCGGVSYKGRAEENSCKIAFVSILDQDGSLDGNIGKLILEKLD